MDFIFTLYRNLPSLDPRTWGPAEFSVISPIATYWTVALIYETFDTLGWFQRYKLLQPEESSKNRASKLEVVRGVLVNHSMMMFFGWLDLALEPEVRWQRISDPLGITQAAMQAVDESKILMQSPALTWLVYAALVLARVLVALFIYDTWQYWVHLGLHMKFLYRRIHIWHHLLVSPMSYAANYVHPFESLLLDAIGPGLTCLLVGLTPWERIVVFGLSVLKTLDDHSGYRFPWDPIILLGRVTGSDIIYHTVHHQPWGIKSNYALWFTFWDHANGTMYRGAKSLNLTPEFVNARGALGSERKEHEE